MCVCWSIPKGIARTKGSEVRDVMITFTEQQEFHGWFVEIKREIARPGLKIKVRSWRACEDILRCLDHQKAQRDIKEL